MLTDRDVRSCRCNPNRRNVHGQTRNRYVPGYGLLPLPLPPTFFLLAAFIYSRDACPRAPDGQRGRGTGALDDWRRPRVGCAAPRLRRCGARVGCAAASRAKWPGPRVVSGSRAVAGAPRGPKTKHARIAGAARAVQTRA